MPLLHVTIISSPFLHFLISPFPFPHFPFPISLFPVPPFISTRLAAYWRSKVDDKAEESGPQRGNVATGLLVLATEEAARSVESLWSYACLFLDQGSDRKVVHIR